MYNNDGKATVWASKVRWKNGLHKLEAGGWGIRNMKFHFFTHGKNLLPTVKIFHYGKNKFYHMIKIPTLQSRRKNLRNQRTSLVLRLLKRKAGIHLLLRASLKTRKRMRTIHNHFPKPELQSCRVWTTTASFLCHKSIIQCLLSIISLNVCGCMISVTDPVSVWRKRYLQSIIGRWNGRGRSWKVILIGRI